MGLAFFADAGLTQPLVSIEVMQATDASSPAVDRVVWLASDALRKRYRAASAPGVAPIVVSPADAVSGGGVQPAHIALATSAAGLAAAVPGAALAVGLALLSGSGKGIEIHLRVKTGPLAAARYADLSLSVNILVEEAIND